MKVPQHPNIGLAIEALEKGNSDAAWHLLRAIPKQTEVAVDCRTDGRCQYAIDHGAEGMGHCPKGKCVMPQENT